MLREQTIFVLVWLQLRAWVSTAIDDILAQRKKDGPFKSIEDFARRVNSRVCNRKVYESLIKAGAFDCFATPDKPAPNGFTGSRSQTYCLISILSLLFHKNRRRKPPLVRVACWICWVAVRLLDRYLILI